MAKKKAHEPWSKLFVPMHPETRLFVTGALALIGGRLAIGDARVDDELCKSDPGANDGALIDAAEAICRAADLIVAALREPVPDTGRFVNLARELANLASDVDRVRLESDLRPLLSPPPPSVH